MHPYSLSAAVLRRNWHFVLTMLLLVIVPRGIQGKQGGRLAGSPAPAPLPSGAGREERWRMPSRDVCPALSSPAHRCVPALPSLTIPVSKKPPGTAPAKPRGGQQLHTEQDCTQEERGSVKHQRGHNSPGCFRLQNQILSV